MINGSIITLKGKVWSRSINVITVRSVIFITSQHTLFKIFAVIPIEKNLNGQPNWSIKNNGTKILVRLQKLKWPVFIKLIISLIIVAPMIHEIFIYKIKIQSIIPSSNQ